MSRQRRSRPLRVSRSCQHRRHHHHQAWRCCQLLAPPPVWLCCCCCCCQLHLHHRRQPVCASHKCVSLAWFECASARLPLPPSSSFSSFILFLPHFPPSSVIPAVTPFDSPVHTNNSLKAALVTYCCQNASSQFADVLVCCQCITYTHDVIDQMCQLRALPPRRQRAVSETGDQCCQLKIKREKKTEKWPSAATI